MTSSYRDHPWAVPAHSISLGLGSGRPSYHIPLAQQKRTTPQHKEQHKHSGRRYHRLSTTACAVALGPCLPWRWRTRSLFRCGAMLSPTHQHPIPSHTRQDVKTRTHRYRAESHASTRTRPTLAASGEHLKPWPRLPTTHDHEATIRLLFRWFREVIEQGSKRLGDDSPDSGASSPARPAGRPQWSRSPTRYSVLTDRNHQVRAVHSDQIAKL